MSNLQDSEGQSSDDDDDVFFEDLEDVDSESAYYDMLCEDYDDLQELEDQQEPKPEQMEFIGFTLSTEITPDSEEERSDDDELFSIPESPPPGDQLAVAAMSSSLSYRSTVPSEF